MRNVHLKLNGSQGDRINYQIPSTNNQTMFEISMTEILKKNNNDQNEFRSFELWLLEFIWSLPAAGRGFDYWNLTPEMS